MTDISIELLTNGKYELQYDCFTGDLTWRQFETLTELLEYLRKMVEEFYE